MLARTMRTAEELGMTQKALDALVETLGVLEREETSHVSLGGRHMLILPRANFSERPAGFNMRLLCNETPECGTVCCVLGWMRHLSGDNVLCRTQENSVELNNLFCM